jgi:hypothetical protein
MVERTGKMLEQEASERSLARIKAALAQGDKRAALADEVGVSDGQLSKLLGGDLRRLCQITQALGLEIFPTEYVDSLQRVLKEKL